MPQRRTQAEIEIMRGAHRAFEWYWTKNGTMPALDAYETLRPSEQDDFFASLAHWGSIPPGRRSLQSRVNDENDAPKIVSVKAGKHRFTAFRAEGSTWIVVGHYLKEGTQRDKTGDRAVKIAIRAHADYFESVRKGAYYERH